MDCYEQGHQLPENELGGTSVGCPDKLVNTLVVNNDISISPLFEVFVQSFKAVH